MLLFFLSLYTSHPNWRCSAVLQYYLPQIAMFERQAKQSLHNWWLLQTTFRLKETMEVPFKGHSPILRNVVKGRGNRTANGALLKTYAKKSTYFRPAAKSCRPPSTSCASYPLDLTVCLFICAISGTSTVSWRVRSTHKQQINMNYNHYHDTSRSTACTSSPIIIMHDLLIKKGFVVTIDHRLNLSNSGILLWSRQTVCRAVWIHEICKAWSNPSSLPYTGMCPSSVSVWQRYGQTAEGAKTAGKWIREVKRKASS